MAGTSTILLLFYYYYYYLLLLLLLLFYYYYYLLLLLSLLYCRILVHGFRFLRRSILSVSQELLIRQVQKPFHCHKNHFYFFLDFEIVMSQFYNRVQAAVDRARSGEDAHDDEEGSNLKIIYFCVICYYFRFRVCARWGPVLCCL